MTDAGSKTVKVSVVCAWYNRSKHLRSTIDSLLNQSLEEIEIIIINDGSSDPAVSEILRSYSDKKIKIVNQENIGFVRSLIKGIELSSGDYIAIQGAGDQSDPERLKEQCEFLEQYTDVAAVGVGYSAMSESGFYIRYTSPQAIVTKESLRKSVPFTHGTIMYRKNALLKVGGYDQRFKYCSDWELYHRLIDSFKICSINKPLYQRVEFDDGFSFDPRKKFIQYEYSKKARNLHGHEIGFRKYRILVYLLITLSMAFKAFGARRYRRGFEWTLQVFNILSGRVFKYVDNELFWM